jgi:hypothetical protein
MTNPFPVPSEMLIHPGLVDGRQSQAALDIARGTRRLLLSHNLASLPEVSLANGRRADITALSDRGEIWIVEIKSCVDDFRADNKWPEYREFCDRLFFAVAPDFPQQMLPPDTGLIVADRFGAMRPCTLFQPRGARHSSIASRVWGPCDC